MEKIIDVLIRIERIIGPAMDSHRDLFEATDQQILQCAELVAKTKKTLDSLLAFPSIFGKRFCRPAETEERQLHAYQSQFRQRIINLELCIRSADVEVTYQTDRGLDEAFLVGLDEIQCILERHEEVVDGRVQLAAKRCLADGTLLCVSTSLENPDDISSDESNADPDNLLVLVREAMSKREYSKAAMPLSTCLKAMHTPSKRRPDTEMAEEVHLLFAICSFYLRDSTSALTELMSALYGGQVFHKNIETRCEAMHCLILVYLRLNKLNKAAITGEALSRSLLRSPGKKDKVHKIFALLVMIYEARQDPEHAAGYRIILPAKNRERYLNDAEQILLEAIGAASKPRPKLVDTGSGSYSPEQ